MAARSFGRSRSEARNLRRRGVARPSERRDGVVSDRSHAGPRGLGCPDHAAAPLVAAGDLETRALRELPPPLRGGEHGVVSQIQMEWGHRDIAFLDRAKIGRLLARPGDRTATDPVELTAP